MKRLLIFVTAVLLIGCGGKEAANSPAAKESGRQKFTVKVGETDRSFAVKDSIVLNTSHDGVEDTRKGQKQAEHTFVLSSYSFEGQPMRSTPAGEVRVSCRIQGEWVAAADPISVKPGTYVTGSNGPMSVADFNIILNENGKEIQNYKTYGFTGSLKVTSVEGDTVKGEVDLSVPGVQSIKGSFTVKQEVK